MYAFLTNARFELTATKAAPRNAVISPTIKEPGKTYKVGGSMLMSPNLRAEDDTESSVYPFMRSPKRARLKVERAHV